jgi:hypothetical protein
MVEPPGKGAERHAIQPPKFMGFARGGNTVAMIALKTDLWPCDAALLSARQLHVVVFHDFAPFGNVGIDVAAEFFRGLRLRLGT